MDVFYFRSSPRKATSVPRRSPITHRKASITKRRRSGSMEAYNTHACVVRFDEPTFCPSNVSAIFANYSLPLAGSVGSGSQSVPDLLEDDEDTEDDSGGVPLTPQQAAPLSPQVADSSFNASAHPSILREQSAFERLSATGSAPLSGVRDGITADPAQDQALSMPHRISTPSPAVPPSVLGSRHPRPITQDLGDEEDSRRLRFALDGDDISGVPRFEFPQGLGIASQDETGSGAPHLPSTGMVTPSSLAPATDIGMPDALDHNQEGHAAVPADAVGGGQDTQPPHDYATYAGRVDPLLDTTTLVDDDGISMADPRRSYDFADFMDDWRLRSILDKQMRPLKAGPQPSMRSWCPPLHLTRDKAEAQCIDMQGIDWRMIGPTRQDALAARVQMCDNPSDSSVDGRGQHTRAHRARDEEAYYRFRSFTPRHRAYTSHYQLRNVLVATSRSDIFYSTGNAILRTSLACPSSKDIVMDLPKPTRTHQGFRLTCLATSGSLVIAGGFEGEYAVRRIDAEDGAAVRKGHVTLAYNGLSTHIHAFPGRRSGLPLAAFCSNDRKVRLMDLQNLNFTDEFTYSHAINCAVTSPDGRLRALVGDCRDAYITDAEKGDTILKLRGHLDHGFACAWSANGTYVATGAQDDRTLIWDTRNFSEPLHSLPNSSCPRSLHFADDGTLVVAEDHDIVSIFDASTFRKRQDIRFFGSIVGVALLDGGAEMAVANADSTVGGLLTFSRAAQGLNVGTFGERLPPWRRAPRWTSPPILSNMCI